MHVSVATDPSRWDAYLHRQRYRPFLQSWTMGEVYRAIGQTPVRLIVSDGDAVHGIAFGHVVPARRGRHLSVPYGPIANDPATLQHLISALQEAGRAHGCHFVRLSPFQPTGAPLPPDCRRSPLHLLAEHVWYLPLTHDDAWTHNQPGPSRTSDDLFKNFRATHRNLIRRAEKDGVTISRSPDPKNDLGHFLRLHDDTRKRHHFTPYSTAFFRAQVGAFAARGELTLYLAHYQEQVIATAIHIHAGGETSYHHGASSSAHAKIPASYLLQWTAIQDAVARGDRIYNFWGIAPSHIADDGKVVPAAGHPFTGVTTFKTGFGGTLLNLEPCYDTALSPLYHVTRSLERYRKWKRGF